MIYSVRTNKQPCCLFPRTNQKNVVRRTCLWTVVLTVLIIEERWHLMFNTEIFCEQIACSGDSVFMWGGDIMYGDYANMVKYFSLSFLGIIGLMLFLVFNKLSFLKNGVCQFNIIIISCFFFPEDLWLLSQYSIRCFIINNIHCLKLLFFYLYLSHVIKVLIQAYWFVKLC